MDINNLSDEQKKMLENCKTPEDYMNLASKLGISLTDDQLDMINGGAGVEGWADPPKCPKCGSKDVSFSIRYDVPIYHCNKCGYEW